MDEEFEMELYEQPDYEVWETNRVYEDLALERAEAEADEALADSEALTTIITDAVAWREYSINAVDDEVIAEIVAALINAGVKVPEPYTPVMVEDTVIAYSRHVDLT